MNNTDINAPSYQNIKCSRTDMASHKHYLCLFLVIAFIAHIESLPTTNDNNTGKKAVEDNWSWGLSDRTWRWNRKALVPVLIGLAAKALLLIPLALTGLAITGSVAMLTGKLSLIISGFMFLKRFLSGDRSTGGFFGLNPFGFPHATNAPHYDKGLVSRLHIIRNR